MGRALQATGTTIVRQEVGVCLAYSRVIKEGWSPCDWGREGREG